MNTEGSCVATGNAMLRGDGPLRGGTAEDCDGSHKSNCAGFGDWGKDYRGHEATREATERLIERGFVRGERLKGADGVYFKQLKLSPKGEQTAISHRKEVEDFKKELPRIVKEANAVAAEIAEWQKKNPSGVS